MKKEKLYKIEKEEQIMIDAFKQAVEDCFSSGRYGRKLDFEEIHNKDGYCIIAVLDYGKFEARVSYNPNYLLADFLDVKFKLGGRYNYSIYNIFNLFDIQDFNQYYYSSIEIKENMDKDVIAILDMINKYSYDIEKACDEQNLLILDSNVESDYKNTFVKDKEETWREDIDNPLELDIVHPFFANVSSATNSDKLLKKMKKQNAKNNLGTLYEQRLLKYLEQGNRVINENVVEDKKQEKNYLRIKTIVDVCIFLAVMVITAVFLYLTKKSGFEGAYVPREMIVIGPITFPFSVNDVISLLLTAVPISFGIDTLFSKLIFKKMTNGDNAAMQRYNKENQSDWDKNKFTKAIKYIVSVGAIIFGIVIACGAVSDKIGFYDDYVRFDDNMSFTRIDVSYEDVKIARILGEYDEYDEYKDYTDVVSYVVYDREGRYYALDYLSPNGETATRIEKIIVDYDKEVKEYKTLVDFEDEINSIEEVENV